MRLRFYSGTALAAALASSFTTAAAAFQINPNTVALSRSAAAAASAALNRRGRFALSVVSSTPTTTTAEEVQVQPSHGGAGANPDMPELGEDGIYHLSNPEQHAALLETVAKDKLLILKVFAPWCRACKGLEPKFQKLTVTPEYNENVPIVWASLSIKDNKAFVKDLGVLALPTVQFYVGGSIVDTFPCGPSKVPILKQKLTALVADYVEHGALKAFSIAESVKEKEEAAIKVKQDAVEKKPAEKEDVPKLSAEERRRMEESIPYFSSLSLADKDQVLDKAIFMKFEPGSILMREGRMGRLFYVIQTGEVEICQKSAAMFYDPMVQQAAPDDGDGYLGSVVNRLGPNDYFGERALITGEPRAASLRVGTEPVTLWAFDQDVFPASCVLSGKSKNTKEARAGGTDLDEKYGVVEDLDQLSADVLLSKQLRDSATASQVRGSVNTPEPLAYEEEEDVGIDVDEVVDADFADQLISAPPPTSPPTAGQVTWTNDDAIFSLLTRFQMIRHVSKCFKYIQKTRALWGDPGSRTRRNMLASRLSPSQNAEFREIFQLIDANGDGYIELDELKRVMESIGEDDAEVRDVLQSNDVVVNGNEVPFNSKMTFEDYLGLMVSFRLFFGDSIFNYDKCFDFSRMSTVFCSHNWFLVILSSG